jgi:hypothetical protein
MFLEPGAIKSSRHVALIHTPAGVSPAGPRNYEPDRVLTLRQHHPLHHTHRCSSEVSDNRQKRYALDVPKEIDLL